MDSLQVIDDIAYDIEYTVLYEHFYEKVTEEHLSQGTLKMVGFFNNPYAEEAHRRTRKALRKG